MKTVQNLTKMFSATVAALFCGFLINCSDQTGGVNPLNNTYRLTVIAGIGGNVNPSAASYRKVGEHIVITASPLPQYSFLSWTTTSDSVVFTSEDNVEISFIMPAAAVTVTANFLQNSDGNGNDGDTKTIAGIECVLVKAGTFMMGSPTSESGRENDETRYKVTLTKDYWISKYPVTQAQYRSAMGNNPSYYKGDNKPVEYLTWDDANAFCKAAGGRLPTEAEWEFAARGGNKRKNYIYSGSDNLNEVGWYWGNSSSGTQPVGQKKANELGIYDMSGNVWEWCSNWYGSYPTGSATDPAGPSSGSYRVFRGGGSCCIISQLCRVASRYNGAPSIRTACLGFRVVFNSSD
ncbi:MAG: SUMF1/EgtB/PvdO family nonheme iron enzyme [Chitinispirillales bacterium]|jgi:formylglycine-generating enzyme required for sulfatase activity|nr:SUMF1/EgtB/PvdO family nonheme iron enzyme [Chitinispirillales bacterium]